MVLYNVFDKAATPMLFFKIEEKYWAILKSFLVYMSRMPLEQIGSTEPHLPLDGKVLDELRKL